MKILRTLLLGAAFLCGTAAAADDTIKLGIEPGAPGAKIDRNIFGQFAEHLGHGIYGGIWVGADSNIPNTRGIRNDVVAALKAIKVPNIRWPGGCFADEYHWRKGVGPQNQRPATLNPNWGGVIEPNTFGTHEFMDFLQQVGSEAYVSINVGSGTPAEAADWLEYMTTPLPTALAKERGANGHPGPFNVSFLGIGNEAWGCGGSMTPDVYVDHLKVFARYARNYNAQHPMKRIAVGPDGDHTGYTEAVMKAWKDKVWSWDIEGLSLHSYTVVKWPPAFKATGFGEDEYATILKTTLKMEDLIRTHGAIMDKYDPDKKVALVVDEWGAWYASTPGTDPGFLEQQNSQRDAVLAALNLNIFARHADRVRMANIAQMINVLQAMIFTDGPKMVLTPTYHVFRMYVPFQDATFVPVKLDAGTYKHGDIELPRLDAIAARDSAGKLWLAVTNVDATRPASLDIEVAGVKPKRAMGETLAAPQLDSVNTFAAPSAVVPKPLAGKVSAGKVSLTLPPASVSVFSLE